MSLIISYQNYKNRVNNLCVVRDMNIPYIIATSKKNKEQAIINYKKLYKKYYNKTYTDVKIEQERHLGK